MARSRAVSQAQSTQGRATDVFPSVRSLLAPDALAKMVAEHYGWHNVSSRLIKATSRDVYLVDAQQGPAVLIVYRHNRGGAAPIEGELDILDSLADRGPEAGVVVAPAMRTLEGTRLLTVTAPEGVRHAALFRFIHGLALDRAPDVAAARSFGSLVARMHVLADTTVSRDIVAQNRPRLDAALLIDQPLAMVDGLFDHDPEALEELRRIGAQIGREIEALPREGPGYGLIHGDVIPTNVLMQQDGRLALLDFDFCGLGWRAFDVATFLRDAETQAGSETTGGAFLAGYQDVRPLAAWERSALPIFMAARGFYSLSNWRWRVEEWGTSALPPGLLSRLVSAIRSDTARIT